MLVAEIVARIRADVSGFTTGMAKVRAESDLAARSTGTTLTKALADSESRMQKAGVASSGLLGRFHGLGEGITGLSTKAGTGFAGLSMAATAGWGAVAAAVIGIGVVSVKAYKEHQVALDELQNAINRTPQLVGASVEAFDAQAKSIALATGADRDHILAADEVLARFNLNKEAIKGLIPYIVDYAQRMHIDVDRAALNVGRAFIGNSRALKALGIDFHATGNRALDASRIMDLLKAHVGGASEAFGKTAAGQMARFKQTLNSTAIDIGRSLMPSVQSLIGAGLTLAQAVGPVLIVVFKGLAIAIRIVADAITFVVKGWMLYFHVVGVVVGWLKTAVTWLGHVTGAFKLFGAAAHFVGGVVHSILHPFGLFSHSAGDAKTKVDAVAKSMSANAYEARHLARSYSVLYDGSKQGAKGFALTMTKAQQMQHMLLALGIGLGHFSGAGVGAIHRFASLTGQDFETFRAGAVAAIDKADNALSVYQSSIAGARKKLAIGQMTQADFNKFEQQARTTFGNSKNAVVDFARQAIDAIHAWKVQVADSLNFVKGSLQDLAGQDHLTASQIIREFDRQLKSMDAYRRNWDIVANSGIKGAKDFLANGILPLGQDGGKILQALASGNKEQMRKIIGDWNQAGGKSNDLATVIQRDLVGSIKDLINIIKGIPGWRMVVDTSSARSNLNNVFLDAKKEGFVFVRHSGGMAGHGPATRRDGRLAPNEVPAVLLRDEFVVNPRASRLYRRELEQINRYHAGGAVDFTKAKRFHDGGTVGVGDVEYAAKDFAKLAQALAMTGQHVSGAVTAHFKMDPKHWQPGGGPIVAAARAELGKPYVFGASGPNAFDCSGLVYWALNHAGYPVPRTSARGYQAMFHTAISRGAMLGGDLPLYWFPNSRGIPRGQASHIGIYAGGGRMINALHSGAPVKYDPIFSAFIGARRVAGQGGGVHHLGDGGIASRAVLALLGERGHDEAVEPLPHGWRSQRAGAGAISEDDAERIGMAMARELLRSGAFNPRVMVDSDDVATRIERRRGGRPGYVGVAPR